jgi:hypothetical protein
MKKRTKDQKTVKSLLVFIRKCCKTKENKKRFGRNLVY